MAGTNTVGATKLFPFLSNLPSSIPCPPKPDTTRKISTVDYHQFFITRVTRQYHESPLVAMPDASLSQLIRVRVTIRLRPPHFLVILIFPVPVIQEGAITSPFSTVHLDASLSSAIVFVANRSGLMHRISYMVAAVQPISAGISTGPLRPGYIQASTPSISHPWQLLHQK